MIINDVFANKEGPARDIVCLNAGAAIYVAGLVDSLAAGVKSAAKVISNGDAAKKFKQLIDKTSA